jgi:hypothetical protein
MAGITTELSISTLHVSSLNISAKDIIYNWIKKDDLTICLQETHLKDKNIHWLMVKGLKKSYQDNGP